MNPTLKLNGGRRKSIRRKVTRRKNVSRSKRGRKGMGKKSMRSRHGKRMPKMRGGGIDELEFVDITSLMNTINENGSQNITSVVRFDTEDKMNDFVEKLQINIEKHVNFYNATSETDIAWLIGYLTCHKLTENREINTDSKVILLIFSKGIAESPPEVVIEGENGDLAEIESTYELYTKAKANSDA